MFIGTPFFVIFGAIWAGTDRHKHGRMSSGTAVFEDQGWSCVVRMKEFSASPLTVYRRPGLCLFFSHSWPEESLASCTYRLEHGSHYNAQLAWNRHLEFVKAPTHPTFSLYNFKSLNGVRVQNTHSIRECCESELERDMGAS